MQDKLLIVSKTKKTIELIDKCFMSCPRVERELKNKLLDTCDKLLESTYKANLYQTILSKKELLVKIFMIDYYIKLSLEKKIINYKKCEQIGSHLLELNKMITAWIKYETKK